MKNEETLEEVALKLFPDQSFWIGSGSTSRLYDPNERDRNKWIEGAKWQQEQDKKLYSKEDMIRASEYGYNFHKTTQFPNQNFEDSCVRNTQQWLTTFKKK